MDHGWVLDLVVLRSLGLRVGLAGDHLGQRQERQEPLRCEHALRRPDDAGGASHAHADAHADTHAHPHADPHPDPHANTHAPTPTPTPTPFPTPAGIQGIDISHWQVDAPKTPIDWAKVAAAGKRFAFIKATDGFKPDGVKLYKDPTYTQNRAGAKASGLLVGAYHFADPDLTLGDAVIEADHFIDYAQPVSGELLPVLDLEADDFKLTDAQMIDWVKAFLERVYERTGLRALIYTNPSFWTNQLGNSSWFADNGYPVLWIAHWKPAAGVPTVPAANWGGEGWTFWQYTSDGTVPGIVGRVDLNVYRDEDFTPVLIP